MFRVNDRADGVHRFIQLKIAVDDHVIERLHAVKFLARRGNADG